MQCVLSSRGLTACIHTNLQPRYRPHSPVRRACNRAYVNVSTDAMPPTWHCGHQHHPKLHVLRRFGQAIPPLPPARSLARVSVPTACCAPRATGVYPDSISHVLWSIQAAPSCIMYYTYLNCIKINCVFCIHEPWPDVCVWVCECVYD